MATRLHNEIEAGRVSVHLPNSYTAYVDVRGHLFALNHGDDVQGYNGIPWYGFERRNNRVQTLLARMGEQAKYFVYGHYHTGAEFKSAGGESLHSGAWAAADTYALNKLAVGNEPMQPLYVVGDKHGIVIKAPIFTRDPEKEKALERGEYEPSLGRQLIVNTVTPKPIEGLQVIR